MGFNGIEWGLMGFNGIYPLVNIHIAMETGPVEIVDFPIDSMVDLPLQNVNVHQRVPKNSPNIFFGGCTSSTQVDGDIGLGSQLTQVTELSDGCKMNWSIVVNHS